MFVGIFRKVPGFGFIYRIIKRSDWPKPDIILDNPEHLRFAQAFGAMVNFAGTLSLFTGASVIGWALIWLVVAMAALNLFSGFCVGCAVYYWMNRLTIPGLAKSQTVDIYSGILLYL
jgi:hypothetical protein